MVIQCLAQLADRMREGLTACVAVSPNVAEQFFMGHDIARPRGEVQQYFDGLWPHMSGLTSVGYQPFQRLDQYIAQVESLYQLGLQLFFTFVPGRPNDSSRANF